MPTCRLRGYVYDTDTGLYYLQSRYYNPEIGRFINADVYTSTGQGVLGNNMFVYCGNNPISRSDPTGNAFVHIGFNYTDTSDLLFPTLGGGGGSTMVAAGCISQLTDNRGREGELKETVKQSGNVTGYGKILPWAFSMLTLNTDGLTIIDANVALFDVTYEWLSAEFTLMRAFSLEASAGITKKDGIYVEAMASIVSSSLNLDFWLFEVTLTGYLGGFGGKVGFDLDGFTIGAANVVGGEVSVQWSV